MIESSRSNLNNCKEDGQKLLDFRSSFDSGYEEPITSGIAGMKRRSWNGAHASVPPR